MKKALKITLSLLFGFMLALTIFAGDAILAEDNAYAAPVDYSALTSVAPSSGTGTSGDPYRVSTLANVKWLSEQVLAGNAFSGQHFLQTGDIDFTEVTNFCAIGLNSSTGNAKPFSGTYNGGGFAIINFSIKVGNTVVSGAGFFYELIGASVSNIIFTNASVEGYLYAATQDYYTSNIGILAGSVNSSVISHITLNGGSVKGAYNVGGLAGSVADSSVSYVRSSAGVYSKNTDNKSVTGGLVGQWSIANSASYLSYSYSIGNVVIGNAEGDAGRFGGLIGNIAQDVDEDEYLEIFYCYFAGSVSASSNPSVAIGALLGVDVTASSGQYNVNLVSNLYLNDFISENFFKKPFPGYTSQTTASQVKGLSAEQLSNPATLLVYSWDAVNKWVVDTSKSESATAVFGKYPDFKSFYATTRFIVEKQDGLAVTSAETNYYSEVAVVAGNTVTVQFSPVTGKKLSYLNLQGTDVLSQVEGNKIAVTVPLLANPTDTYSLSFRFDTATYALSVTNLGYIGESAPNYGLGGRVNLNVSDRNAIAYGTTVEFTLIPSENFKFNGTVEARDSTGGKVTVKTIQSGVKYSFVMRDDIYLEVSWAKLEVDLTAKLNLTIAGTVQLYAGTIAEGISADGFATVTSGTKAYRFYAGDTVTVRVLPSDSKYRFEYFKAQVNKSAAYSDITGSTVYTDGEGWQYCQVTFSSDIRYLDIQATLIQVINLGIYIDSEDISVARVVIPIISSAPLPASAGGLASDYIVPYNKTLPYNVYYVDNDGAYVFVGDADITSANPGSFVLYESSNPTHASLQRYALTSSGHKFKLTDKNGGVISTIKIKNEGSEVRFNFESVKYSLQLLAEGGSDAVVFKYTTVTDGSASVDDFIGADKNKISVVYGTAVKISVQPKGSKFAGWTLNDKNGAAFDMGSYQTVVNQAGATVLVFDFVIDKDTALFANIVSLWTVAVVNPSNTAGGAGGIVTVNGASVVGMPINYEVETGATVQVLVQVNKNYTLNLSKINYTNYTFYIHDSKTYYTFTIENIKAYTPITVSLTPTTYTPNIFVENDEYGKIIISSAGASLTYGTQFKVRAESNYGYRFVYWLINEGKSGETRNENIEYTHTVTGNDSIEAVFEAIDTGSVIYRISVVAGTGISAVTRGGEFYYANESVTIEAIVKNGYIFEGWYANGVLVADSNNARYSFNVAGNQTFEARAVPQTFEVSTVAGSGYTITKSSTKAEYSVGEVITFNCILNSGYEFVEWLVNGAKVGNNKTTLRLTITEKVTVSAVVYSVYDFEENTNVNKKYKLTFICDDAMGSVTYDNNSVLPGETVTAVATPKTSSYVFKYWLVNGSILGHENKMILRSIEDDYTVTAVFEPAPRVITYSTGEGGSVVNGDTIALNGSISSISIEADYGYRIASITVGDQIVTVNDRNFIYDLVVDSDKEVIIEFQKVFLSSVELGIIVASTVLIFTFVLILLLVMKRKPKASFEKLIKNLQVNKPITILKQASEAEGAAVMELPQSDELPAIEDISFDTSENEFVEEAVTEEDED